ncbi:MAG: hypothetical protein NT118_00875 [Lentisphaerae bacterium]|nr:hypothetical protein [Lentisphaerota bacterium]
MKKTKRKGSAGERYVFGRMNITPRAMNPRTPENISKCLRYLRYADFMIKRFYRIKGKQTYFRNRSFVTAYMEMATETIERITVRMGFVSSHWSNLNPENTPARMIASI